MVVQNPKVGGPSKEPTSKKLPIGAKSTTAAAPPSPSNPLPSQHLKGNAQERKVGQPPSGFTDGPGSGAAQASPFAGGMAPGKRYKSVDDHRQQ